MMGVSNKKVTENIKQHKDISFFLVLLSKTPYFCVWSPTVIQLFALQKQFKLALNKTPLCLEAVGFSFPLRSLEENTFDLVTE